MVNRRRFVQLVGAAALVAAAPIKAMAYRWGPPADGQPPRRWLLCDGRYLDRKDYPDLFNEIGTKYGGFKEWYCRPGIPAEFVREVFRLPDLRAKVEGHSSSNAHNHMIKAIPNPNIKDDPMFGMIALYNGSEDRMNALL